MSGFHDMVAADLANVFFNQDEYAEPRTIVYDDITYKDVPCILTKTKETERTVSMRDHAEGLHLVTSVLHYPVSELNGIVPEMGKRIRISESTGFLYSYYVIQSECTMGKVRAELEAYDE